jgi:hypothetical protein
VTGCRRVPRCPPIVPLTLVVAALLAAPSCGKKGPPLAPRQVVPAAVAEPAVRRLGGDIHLQFTIPAGNADGSTPADVARVEVYAVDGPAVDPAGRPLDAQGFARAGLLVGHVEVRPAQPPAGDAEAAVPAVEDRRPAQGERAVVVDRSPKVAQPPPAPEPPADDEEGPMAPALLPPDPPAPVRTYGIVPASARQRLGQLASVRVEFRPLPPPPAPPAVAYTESALTLEWPVTAGGRRPIQPPATGDLLPARPWFETGTPRTYNVYAVEATRAPGTGAARAPTPLNPTPLEAPMYEEAGVEFGVERCFVVRAVETRGNVTAESEPSEPACVTPRDTFPPAAPRHLAAVGSEGVISLIWEANEEPDLGGYLVLRGEVGVDPLRAITPTPIQETTYRDAGVLPGVRYVYAVVAVDTASPPNRSAESNRVEESAR